MGYYKTNCRQAVPRVVRGNDFTAMVLVTRRVPSEGGKETEPVNLSRCTGITARRVTRLGRRTEMGFSIDGSYLVVPFDDELPSGSYGFEATGKYANGRDWALRLMPGEFVDIVEPSSAGYTDGSEERDVYEFAAVVLGESMSEAQMDRMNAAIETARAAAEEAAGLTEAMMSGEAERQANEERRKTAETGREDAERKRQLEFEANENGRKTAEAARAEAEDERRKAEAERQAAEKLREDNVNDVRERVVTLEDNAARYAADGGPTARLLDKDGGDIYPRLTADCLPAGGVTMEKLGDDVAASLDETRRGLETAQARIGGLEDKAAEVGGKVATLDGDETVEGSVRKRVKDAVERLVGAAPDTLDTLQKIAEEMQNPESNAAKTVLDQVSGKADKATTLGGYGITDAYTKAEVDGLNAEAAEKYAPKSSVPTKVSELANDAGYLTEHQDISGKADKGSTLAEYGIGDAYAKEEADEMFVKRSGAVLYYNEIKDL